ncbi:MAG: GNAT family N-acetyltransferase [Bdellovibrionales bacterium]
MQSLAAARQWMKSVVGSRNDRSLYLRIRDFQGRIPVHFETDDFLVTSALSGREMLKALELRHEIFLREWQGREHHTGLDVDEYDFMADHLLIYDKRRNDVVGTYRLLCSHFTHDFYSSSEFDLQRFLVHPGVKLEMGRACIHANYRDGNTIDLLWKGLARYIEKSKARYLFGCASVKSSDAAVVSGFVRAISHRGDWSDEYFIRPRPEHILTGYQTEGVTPLSTYKEFLPPLLRSYFHAGAKVYGEPALDQEFDCVDLLTILDVEQLNPRFRARFFSPETAGFVDLRSVK